MFNTKPTEPSEAYLHLKWTRHWIKDLISDETIRKFSFNDWMGGFAHRYTKEELFIMRDAWSQRIHSLL